MPSKKHWDAGSFPPCRLGPDEFREIRQCLGPEFDGVTDWSFWSGLTKVNDTDLDALLSAVAEERNITEFVIEAKLGDTELTISGLDDGCGFEYSCLDSDLARVRSIVRNLDAIFRTCRRRTALCPRVIARRIPTQTLRIHFVAPALAVGAKPEPIIKVNWDSVTENVITNVLSHSLIGLFFGLVGLIVGSVANPL